MNILTRKIANHSNVVGLCLSGLMVVSNASYAHDHPSDKAPVTEVNVEKITDHISMIQADGGNILLFKGDDGVLMVDNGLSDKSHKVQAAIEMVTSKNIDYVVNTHWHFDHTGNNEVFGQNGTMILAHENVRVRLKSGGEIKAFDKNIAPAAKIALPIITYKDMVNVYLNDETITLKGVEPSHTDGDTYIVFDRANVISTGDVFFNGFWPFIDAESGGSLQGVIAVSKEILERVDTDTKIIPGHGAVANKADLQSYYAMLVEVESRISKAKKANFSRQAWIESKPLADLDPLWGQGFLPTQKFTNIAWDAFK